MITTAAAAPAAAAAGPDPRAGTAPTLAVPRKQRRREESYAAESNGEPAHKRLFCAPGAPAAWAPALHVGATLDTAKTPSAAMCGNPSAAVVPTALAFTAATFLPMPVEDTALAAAPPPAPVGSPLQAPQPDAATGHAGLDHWGSELQLEGFERESGDNPLQLSLSMTISDLPLLDSLALMPVTTAEMELLLPL